MTDLIANIIDIGGFTLYIGLIIAAATLPIWGYKLVENKIIGKHKSLRVSGAGNNNFSTSIIASLGTTTAGVFMIQVLPLVFSMINDVGGPFAMDIVFSEHLAVDPSGEFVNEFYGLTAQLGDILQNAAPMAAVGLGGYNLLNNLSRGLPAIRKS